MVANPHCMPIPHPRSGRIKSFHEFYPFYLGEHSNRTCRRLHVAGTSASLALVAAAAVTQQPQLLLGVPVVGYGAAWVGHFCFEHNRPATFRYPGWSLRGDARLWWEVVSGQRPF